MFRFARLLILPYTFDFTPSGAKHIGNSWHSIDQLHHSFLSMATSNMSSDLVSLTVSFQVVHGCPHLRFSSGFQLKAFFAGLSSFIRTTWPTWANHLRWCDTLTAVKFFVDASSWYSHLLPCLSKRYRGFFWATHDEQPLNICCSLLRKPRSRNYIVVSLGILHSSFSLWHKVLFLLSP